MAHRPNNEPATGWRAIKQAIGEAGFLNEKTERMFDMAKPKSSGEMLKLIGNELTLLWVQMDAYQTIFLLEREKRRRLMEETAPGFFSVVQFTLFESLLLRLCRLLDPAEQGGNTNISWQALCQLLTKEEIKDEQVARHGLRLAVKELIEDWSSCCCGTEAKTGEKYIRIKNLRNKVLAHNDFTVRQKIPAGELWVDVSEQDYELIQDLAGRLWSIYRRSYTTLFGKNVVEPSHAKLEGHPAVLLKHLCSSLYFDRVLAGLGDEKYQHFAARQAFSIECMGEDRYTHAFMNTRGKPF